MVMEQQKRLMSDIRPAGVAGTQKIPVRIVQPSAVLSPSAELPKPQEPAKVEPPWRAGFPSVRTIYIKLQAEVRRVFGGVGRWWWVGFAVAIMFLSGTEYWYMTDRGDVSDTAATGRQVSEVVAEVGRLMVLPEGETPILAEVANHDALKDEPFFRFAKEGDAVLLYREAGKVILYRPSEKKIIEVSPFRVTAPAAKNI